MHQGAMGGVSAADKYIRRGGAMGFVRCAHESRASLITKHFAAVPEGIPFNR